ncbi:hypothetical protein ZIOFF_024646 [Zingiber officinale]|uniref:Scarecrow-like protein 6 n=2 Tax=Zingiber officinale TaxID=94328 RepID=A0A8J5H0P6_ZINOF|nr:hypothetical protein ZIOFF_024646 [Zingiber officinale]
MRAFPFHVRRKGGSEAAERVLEAKRAFFSANNGSKLGIQEGGEPRSVLDRRSPSPPTSTATVSSSLGGSGSSDNAGVAAVSESAAGEGGGGGAGWKEEWAAELHPVPADLDLGFNASGAKCGLGVDDWETILSEDSAISPVREQTFLGWIMGDADHPTSARLKQHLFAHSPPDFDVNNGGFGLGILDPGNGSIEDVGTFVAANSVGGDFPFPSSNSWVSPPSTVTSIKETPIFPTNDSQLISPPLPPAGNFASLFSLPPGIYLPDPLEDKLQLFGSSFLFNHQSAAPNPSFFLRVGQAEKQQLSHLLIPTQPKLPFLASGGSSDFFPRQQLEQQQQNPGFSPPQLQQRSVKPKLSVSGDDAATPVAAQQLQQALVDLLIEAAKMVEVRNFVGAHRILARLNHQLPSPSGKPLLRSVFYFKEALQRILCNGPIPDLSCNASSLHQQSPLSMQFDILHKLSAYKTFSEVSPIIQFSNFTCIQALLEELCTSDCIHIIDFDIGVGGQWSSFMQELAQRRLSAANPVRMLKMTVIVSNYVQDNLELHLVRDNLAHFASDLNIPFELHFHSLESSDTMELHVTGGDAVAVNLPIGSGNLPLPSILRLVKQLSPKIVVSVDHGWDWSDLSFSQHFLHTFQSSMVLMDSIDATGTNQDMTAKIEKFLLQPRIESSILGRYLAPVKILPWRTLFTTSGFIPIQLSSFMETQADCLLKRVQVRGFHVEKRQATLNLYWQRKELVSVSAWRCFHNLILYYGFNQNFDVLEFELSVQRLKQHIRLPSFWLIARNRSKKTSLFILKQKDSLQALTWQWLKLSGIVNRPAAATGSNVVGRCVTALARWRSTIWHIIEEEPRTMRFLSVQQRTPPRDVQDRSVGAWGSLAQDCKVVNAQGRIFRCKLSIPCRIMQIKENGATVASTRKKRFLLS